MLNPSLTHPGAHPGPQSLGDIPKTPATPLKPQRHPKNPGDIPKNPACPWEGPARTCRSCLPGEGRGRGGFFKRKNLESSKIKSHFLLFLQEFGSLGTSPERNERRQQAPGSSAEPRQVKSAPPRPDSPHAQFPRGDLEPICVIPALLTLPGPRRCCGMIFFFTGGRRLRAEEKQSLGVGVFWGFFFFS